MGARGSLLVAGQEGRHQFVGDATVRRLADGLLEFADAATVVLPSLPSAGLP